MKKIFNLQTLCILLIGLVFLILVKYFADNIDALVRRGIEDKKQIAALKDKLNKLEEKNKFPSNDPDLLKKYSKVYFLNENYVPISISDIPKSYVHPASHNTQIHTNVLPFLIRMIDAGEAEGMHLIATSAYRSFAAQKELKDGYKVIYGSGANQFSADQGYSEHQLGTTLDFTTKALNGAINGFERTEEYFWLLNNAYKYGFIISYPLGNDYYKFEPWHWRFVGVELASKLHEDRQTFQELDQRVINTYLDKLFK